MTKYLLAALLAAAAACATAQSYEQRAEAERAAQMLEQIDKANMDKARAAVAARSLPDAKQKDDGVPWGTLVFGSLAVVGLLYFGMKR
jgi:hypothetical protein